LRNSENENVEKEHADSNIENHILCQPLNTKWGLGVKVVVFITANEEVIVDLHLVGGKFEDALFEAQICFNEGVFFKLFHIK